MKAQRLPAATIPSASLKRSLLRRRRRRRREVAPSPQEEDDCELCRCSMFSPSGSSRTVQRILTACLLSSLALLASVSSDLSSSFSLLHSTEAAYDELTSCRTRALLHIVTRLQKMRHLFAEDVTNETLEESLKSLERLCEGMAAQRDGHGLACSPEMTGSCQEMSGRTEEFLKDSFDRDTSGEQTSSAFTEAIERLLAVWESVELSVVKVRQNSDWRFVLSARLLVTFSELNHQLMLSRHTTTSDGLHRSWSHTLNYLSFTRVLTEPLNHCWLEHMDLSRNSSSHRFSVFDTSLWQVSGPEVLSGSVRGIQALRNAQQCLLDRAASDLRSTSRSLSSVLSMRICLLAIACLIYPVVMVSFKQMTDWIQNYARTLKEKTEDLKHQRQLAEDLLHQMLPKSVAKQLRRQKHVEAESYERVTIFFSDIVGFTSISASCTPLQVVEMLNNLYMCFDTRIESYDVYKVETIGDAYMVVSGLPERNGDKHADEIAKMALDLVAAVRQVSIPHMPKERLQLRAGIHTGPCVAGIVGYKMPRYCLFGDTVNTASRMESTSLPQKIHTSSETYLALIKDNAYELQLRGEIEVKTIYVPCHRLLSSD
ncbi:uncharacterized protein LOC112140879 isoform X2 [Oryzias melastigma]|uniref:uncharacterized protein LOC112140879 isoform X2 n=1 Tax=Oryzias melastigma TaxID=30732 RepID=UPI00168CAF5C|nr:uncharacterized protein LOC112140879 isoform X2 [Oryzias melastigma]